MKLEEHPFFREAPLENVIELSRSAEVIDFAEGEVIFEEGGESDSLYLVLEGRVGFTKSIPGNPRRSISYSGPGDFFGEVGLFTGESRSLAAVAFSQVRLARIPMASLVDFIRSTRGPIEQILQSVVNHLHHTTRHYVEDILRQEKLAVVGSMVNSIIHDFKNPFTLISLGSQLLRRTHDDPQTQRVCANIEQQVDRMVEMASEIAEYCRGKQELKPQLLNVREVVRRFRELNEPYFQNDRVAIHIHCDDVEIEAEESKLLRILQNLVGNAIDAIPDEDTGLVEIRLKADIPANALHVRVADNGGGIPEEIRENFFEPFVTFGKSRGTGLGSAIVKSLVDAHGGTIAFSSEVGQGTTFDITLPLRQPLPRA